MCITDRIQELLDQKAALDSQIAKLEELENKTAPIKSMLNQLIEEYRLLAPEELGALLGEISKTCDNYSHATETLENLLPVFSEREKQELVAGNNASEIYNNPAPPEQAEAEPITAEEILKSKGFFQTDDPENFDADEKYETYRGWDIYYSLPNGGITAIGLYNAEYKQHWDSDTEYIQELFDSMFPESLADFDEIVAWTRALIDQVENIEAPGQLPLPLVFSPAQTDIKEEDALTEAEYDAAVEAELALDDNEEEKTEQETETDFKAMGFNVLVYPQYAGDNLVGVTFKFKELDGGTLVFSKSLIKAEMGDRNYKTIAYDLIQDYRDQKTERKEKEVNPYKKPEDDFIELVKLSNAVAYLKRRDNGELIAAYVAFSNATGTGEKTVTKAKNRARKWAEWLTANFAWICSEPRVCKRMTSDNSKQEFVYELKITGKFSIGQLTMLATKEDLSLLPGEIAASLTVQQPIPVNDFQFTEIKDFDSNNPEYEVTDLPSQQSFTVWRKFASATAEHWRNSVYPYASFTEREAAAADAVCRLLKAQQAK